MERTQLSNKFNSRTDDIEAASWFYSMLIPSGSFLEFLENPPSCTLYYVKASSCPCKNAMLRDGQEGKPGDQRPWSAVDPDDQVFSSLIFCYLTKGLTVDPYLKILSTLVAP